jgi:iron(III) transport system substrate-binding protein
LSQQTLEEKEMKVFSKLLTIVLLVSFLAGCGTPAATQAPVAEAAEAPAAVEAATEAPAAEAALSAQEQWLMDNQLGSYTTDTQDWAAIEEAAKKEGSVIVYANSSKIAKAAEIWAEMYPDIKLEGYDLGGDEVLSKTVGEQQSGLFVGDVWFSSGGADVVGNVLPHQYIWRFVPDTLNGKVAPEYTEPLLYSRFGTALVHERFDKKGMTV